MPLCHLISFFKVIYKLGFGNSHAVLAVLRYAVILFYYKLHQ